MNLVPSFLQDYSSLFIDEELEEMKLEEEDDQIIEEIVTTKTISSQFKNPLNSELSDNEGIENKLKKMKRNDIKMQNQSLFMKDFTKGTK